MPFSARKVRKCLFAALTLPFFLGASGCDDQSGEDVADGKKLPGQAENSAAEQNRKPDIPAVPSMSRPGWVAWPEIPESKARSAMMALGQATVGDFANGITATGGEGFHLFGQTGRDGWILALEAGEKVRVVDIHKQPAGNGGRSTVFQLRPSGDGGYFTAGSSWWSDRPGATLVGRYDEAGKELFLQSSPAKGFFSEVTGLSVLADGGVLLHELDFVEDGGPIEARGQFRRLSANGEPVWQKQDGLTPFLSDDPEKTPVDILEMSGQAEGDSLLLARRRAVGDLPAHSLLARYDSDGTLQWQRAYEADKASETGLERLVMLPDGSSIAGGFAMYPSSPGGELADAWVVKLDPRGDIRWQILLGEEDLQESVTALQPLKTGGVLVAGATDGGEQEAGRLWLVSLDAEGKAEWRFDFARMPMFTRIDGIAQAADGRLLLVGSALSGTRAADATLVVMTPEP